MAKKLGLSKIVCAKLFDFKLVIIRSWGSRDVIQKSRIQGLGISNIALIMLSCL